MQDGWIGRVLPFDLVQRELLHDDLAAIEADERRVQDIDSEIETILEGFDEMTSRIAMRSIRTVTLSLPPN